MTLWKNLVVALVAAFVLAACSSSDKQTTAPPVDPPAPTPVAVDLKGSTDLGAGTTTIPAGGSSTVGQTTVSCAGTEDCVLTVTKDSVTGGYSATSTGGMVTVAVAPVEPPPEPPASIAVDLPKGHGLSPAEGGETFTVPAGQDMTFGSTMFSCPAGGDACVVTVTSTLGTVSASYTGGMLTVSLVEPSVPSAYHQASRRNPSGTTVAIAVGEAFPGDENEAYDKPGSDDNNVFTTGSEDYANNAEAVWSSEADRKRAVELSIGGEELTLSDMVPGSSISAGATGWTGYELSKSTDDGRTISADVFVSEHSLTGKENAVAVTTASDTLPLDWDSLGITFQTAIVPKTGKKTVDTDNDPNSTSGDPAVVKGTYRGINGSYSFPDGTVVTADKNNKSGVSTSSRTVTFTPNSTPSPEQIVSLDTDWLSMGTWEIASPAAGGITQFGAFVDGGTPMTNATVLAIVGTGAVDTTATYTGPAVGSYADSKAESSGRFTATAKLTATFKDAANTDTITGSLSSFMVDGASQAWSFNLGAITLMTQTVGENTVDANAAAMGSGSASGFANGRPITGSWTAEFFNQISGSPFGDNHAGAVAGIFDGATAGAGSAGSSDAFSIYGAYVGNAD